jgi:hypothetical protein
VERNDEGCKVGTEPTSQPKTTEAAGLWSADAHPHYKSLDPWCFVCVRFNMPSSISEVLKPQEILP